MQPTVFLGLWAIAAFALYRAIAYAATRRARARRARELGCKPAPMFNRGDPLGIGNVRNLLKADREKRLPEYSEERVREISAREGRPVTTMRNVIAGEQSFFTIEPRNIQALLATKFKDFELGKSRGGNFRPLLGHGIFASDGKQWEHSRALLRPQFAREQISDLKLEEEHVQNMFKALPVNADGWTDITDIQVLFFRLTIDSATEFLFGESVDSQLNALPNHAAKEDVPPERDERLFAFAFDKAQWHLARAGRFGARYWVAHTADFRKQCRDVHAFVDYFVQLALRKEAREKELEKGTGRRKEKYVFLDELAAQTRDPVALRDQLLNILLAGRDTTASLLSWLFRLLAQHPATFAKLRRVVLDEFGDYAACDPADITFARLKGCSFLQHTLNETLRLFPVVPLNSRRAAVDTALPLGGGPDGQAPVFVPAGTEVGYSVHVMQRRADVWGPDAAEFRPERWDGRRVGWEYLPFNGGPRICIGQQFALTEASYVVVRLLQRFDSLEGVGMGGRVSHGLTLTSCPGEGVKVRMREAKAA
ncbi:Cytochrome p450 family protein [Neofusicoccum parvum]|uniref:Cytochrome p450 family protein n=1 Tax=Neofusicoccum parvum TaxID=310453 RepID=A0ACB5RNE4_9PEZI|nr:Cytochrome p450 family protein [Neofusicoccum parvum]GME34484.1 Cytochrome p450 family protein [Neofusicoccum parvum]